MTNFQKINPAAIMALKDALSQVYWYKKDMRSFLTISLKNTAILSRVNWDDYKRNIADFIVETLIQNEEDNKEDILNLFNAIATMSDFGHLEFLEDGKEKADKARKSVEVLNSYSSGYYQIWNDKQQIEMKRKEYLEKVNKVSTFRIQLANLKTEYCQLVISSNLQQRGYRLEILFKQLFDLFDLDPKASFKIEGEQIDGAFTFDNNDYLFEGKWQNEFVRAADLDSLAAKVKRKLDNTLGLFLAINGFSMDGINAHSEGRKVLILMDGADLMAVLDERVDFSDILRRKRRHASQTGDIYLQYKDMV